MKPVVEQTDQVFKLSPRLLHNPILALQHDRHPTEIPDFRPAHYQGFNVETPSGKDARDSRQHTGLILYQAIQDVAAKPCKEHAENFRDATHFLKGCKDGGGVLYRIFVTASSAVLDLGRSIEGKGGGCTLWVFL